MSIDFIELLDSQIMTTETVVIEEERIKDEYAVYFNDAQIQSHLTNLLFNDGDDARSIGKKVLGFFNLLASRKSSQSTMPNMFKPIISCKKHVHYLDDDNYKPDAVFEDEQHIFMSAFKDYIFQFHDLNRDTRNKYTTTKDKLDNLARPFITSGGVENHQVLCNTDALDKLDRPLRLINNDKVRLVGYYTGQAKKRQELQLQTYIDNFTRLKTTHDDVEVTIMFNDFAFRNNKLVLQISGHVSNGIVVFDKPVTIDGALVNSMLMEDQRIFVFPKTGGMKPFSKQSIMNGNYAVFFDDPKVATSYLLPSNASQALFVECMTGRPMSLNDILSINGGELEEKHRMIIDWILQLHTKHLPKNLKENKARTAIPPPIFSKNIKQSLETFKTYLEHMLQALDKVALTKQIQQLQGEIQKLGTLAAHANECGTVESRPVKVVHTYSLITQLLADKDKYTDGEHVLLHQPLFSKDIMFVLKTIKDQKTWVRARNMNMCASDVFLSPATDLCIFDSAEKACQKLEQVRILRKKEVLQHKLDILQGLATLVDGDDLNVLITFFDMVARHFVMRNMPFDANFHGHYEKIIADEDLFGDEIPLTFAELINHAEANDVHLPLGGAKPETQVLTELDTITIISKYLDINFTSDQLAFMRQYVSSRYVISNLDKQLLDERTKLMAAINQAMYQSNKGYREKVDAKIEERLKAFMESSYAKFYYDEIVFSTALIQCMLLALYPAVEIARIVPKCSALYSIVGHPISSSKGMENYFACALKQMAVQDDIRYKLILSSNKVEADIKAKIDVILAEDYTIAQQIEHHKELLVRPKTPKQIAKTTEHPLNVSFKPAFNFPHHSTNAAISFLKTLNDVVAKSRYNKTNINKSAFISNFCCPEKLTDHIHYYNLFADNVRNVMANVQQKMSSIDHSLTLFPPMQIGKQTEITQMTMVKQTKWAALQTNDDEHIKKNNISDDEFNDSLYPRLNRNFEQVSKTLPKAIDNVNMVALYFIRDTLINNMNSNPKLHRMVLHTFLSNKLPLLVSRWMNGLVMDAMNDELGKTIRNNMQVRVMLKESWSYVKVFKDMIITSGTEDACIKDIISLLDDLFVYLSLLSTTSGTNAKLVHTMINTITTSLFEHFQNNIFDNQTVLKNIEELREQKKQTMMEAYAVDDEERTIQIQLRNIGLTDWTSIFDRIKNTDLANINGQREEDENYKMTNYAGENDDADEINDDAF
jgi:hypothetical protein